jgi:hypothetical protein
LIQPFAITYDGTQFHASGAHTLRESSAAKVCTKLESFRSAFTNSDHPDQVRIDLYNPGGAQSAYFNAARDACVSAFGSCPHDFSKSPGGTSNWFLEPTQLAAASALIDQLQPIPSVDGLHDIVSLYYQVGFQLVSSGDSIDQLPAIKPEQYLNFEVQWGRRLGESRIEAFLGSRIRVSAFLSLPLAELNDQSRRCASSMQELLPFQLSKTRWKRWKLNGAKNGYIGRKLAF